MGVFKGRCQGLIGVTIRFVESPSCIGLTLVPPVVLGFIPFPGCRRRPRIFGHSIARIRACSSIARQVIEIPDPPQTCARWVLSVVVVMRFPVPYLPRSSCPLCSVCPPPFAAGARGGAQGHRRHHALRRARNHPGPQRIPSPEHRQDRGVLQWGLQGAAFPPKFMSFVDPFLPSDPCPSSS